AGALPLSYAPELGQDSPRVTKLWAAPYERRERRYDDFARATRCGGARAELRFGCGAASRRRLSLPARLHARSISRRGSRWRDVRARPSCLASLRPAAFFAAHVALRDRAQRGARPLPRRVAAPAARAARGSRAARRRSTRARALPRARACTATALRGRPRGDRAADRLGARRRSDGTA